MDETFHAIIQLLQANKVEDVENKYLLNEISFDHIKDSENGDTLLHYFFRHFEELSPTINFEFLLSCFFRCDHLNNDNKTALHLLLEFQIDDAKYFILIKNKGFNFFQTIGNTMSILETIIVLQQSNLYTSLICEYDLEYINQFYYEPSLCLSIKHESTDMLSFLVSNHIVDFFSLFLEFLDKFQLPTEDTEIDENTANYQFYKSIKNSNKKVFEAIFNKIKLPRNKLLTLDMLYCCTDDSFCIYLSNFVKFDKIPEIKPHVSTKIFSLVKDIYTNVYNSRLIIHQAIITMSSSKVDQATKDKNFELIKRIPSIMYDSKDYYGDTPLIYALEYNNTEIAKYLIKHGDIDFCHLGRETTPLHLAVKGRIQILRKMLSMVNKKKYKRVFDINVKDRAQNTPLLAPFYNKDGSSFNMKNINTECLKMIIENGADIFSCDIEGNSILYHSISNWNIVNHDFVNYIISLNSTLTMTNSECNLLLDKLYSQKNPYYINLILDRFEIDPDFMVTIFSNHEILNIEKVYQFLKNQGKGKDYFFEILKKANIKNINSMISTIDGLLFYIDHNDNNNNVLFILANLQTKRINNINSILITVFDSIIQNERKDFLLLTENKNGDNFLQVALRKRNKYLIDSIDKLFQRKTSNKIFQHFQNKKNENELLQLISDLVYQKNNDDMNSIELRTSLFYDLGNIYTLEIFERIPSYIELEKFLEKVKNPNVVQNNEPLILKYVKYEGFDEIEMLRILDLFDRFHCDFTMKQKIDEDYDYPAKICLMRSYYKSFLFLLSHRGVGSFVIEICDPQKKWEFNMDESIEKPIKTFLSYYCTIDVFLYALPICKEIQKFMKKIAVAFTGKNSKHDYREQLLWPVIPVIERFFTFNIHYCAIFDLFRKMLTYELHIPKLFEIVLPYFEEIYNPFYLSVKKVTILYSDSIKTDAWNSKFSEYNNLITDLSNSILNLKKKNPNEQMKKNFEVISLKYKDWSNKILTYFDIIDELNQIINDKKITYAVETNFKLDNLPDRLRFTTAKLFDIRYVFSYSYSKHNTKALMIATDEHLVLASLNNDEIKVFFESSIYAIFKFYTPETKVPPRLKFYTKDGVFDIQQIDYINNLRLLNMFINERFEKFNRNLEIEWNSINNNNIQDDIILYVLYVDEKLSKVVQKQVTISPNTAFDDAKSLALDTIKDSLDTSQNNLWTFSLKPLI